MISSDRLRRLVTVIPRGRHLAIDAAVATVLGAQHLVTGVAWEIAAPSAATVGAALLVRRRLPVTSFVVVSTVLCVEHGFDRTAGVANLSVAVVGYGLAVYGWLSSPTRTLGAAGIGVTGVAMMAVFDVGSTREGVGDIVFTVLLGVVAGTIVSRVRRRQRSLQGEVGRLTDYAEAQVASAREAAAAERRRIACELHDIIAHHVSVMVVHAGALGESHRRLDARQRESVEAITASGRRALAEMRHMVGLLDSPAAEYADAPLPDLTGLQSLIETYEVSGLSVELRASPTAERLDGSIQLAVYRVVQEGLTNVLRHAGPGTTASVTIDVVDDSVKVGVCDDGAGVADPLSATIRGSGGNGIVRMRQRVTVYGGTVEHGSRPEGGHRLGVTIPVRPSVGVR